MKRRSKSWGAFVLGLGLWVMIGSLMDLGRYIGWGVQSTLSQYVADSIPDSGAFYLFSVAGGFCAGMLLNHFTGFGMERSDVVALRVRIAQLESLLMVLGGLDNPPYQPPPDSPPPLKQ